MDKVLESTNLPQHFRMLTDNVHHFFPQHVIFNLRHFVYKSNAADKLSIHVPSFNGLLESLGGWSLETLYLQSLCCGVDINVPVSQLVI